ncbi:hypothetical protein A9K65_013370 [Mesorhizobium sp. WSM1497]|nr:hypothetical protein A9K65_013370 [Mesorhizobium sp. WSM1497]PBC15741.1 hypothetical protein CK225_16320 [Mesorhizobium loti]
MGRWVIVDRPIWTDAPSADDAYVFAPSLRALPAGFPLVIATLPVCDWNGELLRGLNEIEPVAGARCYAAILMIDPFALWEDVADALTEKGFCGVVNLPPASLIQTSSEAGAEDHLNSIELERMRWFAENGLGLALTSTNRDAAAAGNLFEKQPEAMLYLPATALSCPIAPITSLVRLGETGSELPVWSLPAPSLAKAETSF